MRLPFLEKKVEEALKNKGYMKFPRIIRKAREAIGMRQNSAAKFIGMFPNRLKNLELGLFEDMPKEYELKGLSELYNLDRKFLDKKAFEYASEQREKNDRYNRCPRCREPKKPDDFYAKSDGTHSMYCKDCYKEMSSEKNKEISSIVRIRRERFLNENRTTRKTTS